MYYNDVEQDHNVENYCSVGNTYVRKDFKLSVNRKQMQPYFSYKPEFKMTVNKKWYTMHNASVC